MFNRIYLSGSTKLKEYRNYIKEKYSEFFYLLDPLEYNNLHFFVQKNENILPRSYSECKKIVENDKKLIDQSDLVVAFIIEYTVGTLMEIFYAYDRGKTVFIITPSFFIQQDIWLQANCNRFFNSIDQCFQKILKENKNE